MPSDLDLRLNIKGDEEVVDRFRRAGDTVREAVKKTLDTLGAEIAASARMGVPASRARSAIFYRVKDRGKALSVIIDTRRRLRWVQQFEYGTVGTGPDARTGTVNMGVRAHTRRARARDVFQVMGRSRRKLVGTGVVFVRSYTHKFHMPMRPFMRPAFSAARGEIVPRIEEAVKAALSGKGG